MRSEEIRGHLKRMPFRPIRVFVSDGSAYDIPHPDFMIVSRTEVVVALELGNDDMPERFAYVDPVHITRIEPINGQRSTGADGKSNPAVSG
jgi:hypothetical protein